jgi:hypothetical protein
VQYPTRLLGNRSWRCLLSAVNLVSSSDIGLLVKSSSFQTSLKEQCDSSFVVSWIEKGEAADDVPRSDLFRSPPRTSCRDDASFPSLLVTMRFKASIQNNATFSSTICGHCRTHEAT